MSRTRREASTSSGLLTPIFGNALQTPDISGFLQRQAEEPDLFELSEGNAVDHAGGDLGFNREPTEMNHGSGSDRARRASGTSAQVGQDHVAGLRKGLARIPADNDDRDIARNSRTAAFQNVLWCRAQVQGPQKGNIRRIFVLRNARTDSVRDS